MKEVFDIPYWLEPAPPLPPMSKADEAAMLESVMKRADQMRRELRTNRILAYCRYRDSPAAQQELLDVLERHPEWWAAIDDPDPKPWYCYE